MTDLSDLLKATGYAATVYLLFNYLISFGSGRPLVEWINPGRRFLPVLAGVLVGGAYGSLQVAVRRYHLSQAELLRKLVTEDKAPPEVIGTVSLVIFAAAVMMLAVWCWWRLPRSPLTFSPNPRDLVAEYRRALKHYVRWGGGLDFSLLLEVRGAEVHEVAAGTADKDIRMGLARLPGLHPAGHVPPDKPDAELQKQIWRDTAATLVAEWPKLDALLYPSRHGKNVAITFDLHYGALFAEMVEESPAPPGGAATAIFLFAATLNQHEVTSLTAQRHFAMLGAAVRHIRSGVAKG